MKILMGSNYFASHKGGVEIVAQELYRGFARRGHRVRWLAGDATPPPEPIESSSPLPFPILNFVEDKIGLPFPIPTFAAVRKIARAVREADVVLLHDCLYLSNIAAFVAARLRGVPVVVVQHTRITPYSSRILNAIMTLSTALFTRPMLRRAEQVVFISHTTRSFFADVALRRPPEVIFNGVDTETYAPAGAAAEAGERKAKDALRRDFDLPPSAPCVLFVGRFVEKKGLPILRRMVALQTGYTWVFAGWGPLDPGGWRRENVRVFSGLHGSSMVALYRACDVLVLPSTGEGFPLVVQEALACGLPVVCGADTLSADPAMTELVFGVPVHADDLERSAREFLAALSGQLDQSAQSAESRQRRRAFAMERYSWHSACDRYLEIVARLVSGPASAASPVEAGRERSSE